MFANAPLRRPVIVVGTFFGGDVEPGTFHNTERVDDRDDVNTSLEDASHLLPAA